MSNFSHLHVHTEYSILDGLSKIPQLIRKAYADGQRAMAITDHGNMYGVYEYVAEVEKFNEKEAKKDDPFKAIIGCEMYVSQNALTQKKEKSDRGGRHLILLAKDWIGYRNLSRLNSIAFIDGFYYVPRIDKETLRKYSEGLIACSACLGGELAKAITENNLQHNDDTPLEKLDLTEARKVVEEFKDIFKNNYYLEMQLNGHKTQKMVNKAIAYLSTEYNVPYIASNDVHFVNKEDFETHKLLICINTRKTLQDKDSAIQDSDIDTGLAYSGQEYMRTTAEMCELFEEYPEAIINTQRIVNKIETLKLKSKTMLPKFDVPKEFGSEFEYLKHLVYEGAHKRWSTLTDEINERIEFELNTIEKMGFPGYFLIVWDFINAGKKIGVCFGPGRGSAAGSIIAYCIGITNIDPLKYDLLFERFLNPDRISLPDIDIDMDDTGREKVINYVIEKYGKDHVAQIVTFNSMAAKSAVRDCARVLGVDLQTSNRLAKLLPDGGKVTLEASFKEIPEYKAIMDSSEMTEEKKTLLFAQKIEGTVKSTGVHACGVIIGKESLLNLIPLSASKNSETPVTQYIGKYVESAGLLKMDFLGLKTLNIISSTLNLIKSRFNLDIDIDSLPLDDPKTYELLCRGDTTAVFQLESAGMRKYLCDLRPERFEDIIAMVALYRPGPMSKIPSFINRKQGREKITYEIAEMEKYLSDSYGITIYQEQVMLLSQLLAGFTRGQADTLRKAMGKKQISTMMELEKDFITKGEEKGHDTKVLQQIWEEWKKFAEYAFNKSHATCYALVAYQTAYLKAHYTAEFMAANLTNNLNNMENIKKFIEDIQHAGIKILGPDINNSMVEFSVNKQGDIVFGMAALSGVGTSAIEAVVSERENNGHYKDIFDFISRINLKVCTKKSIEALVYTGAFDSFTEIRREQFFKETDKSTFLEKLITWGNKKKNGNSQQFSIFDATPEIENLDYPNIPDAEKWSLTEKLQYEKNVAGFYISGHPLSPYQPIIDSFTNTSFEDMTTNGIKNFLNRSASFAAMVVKAESGMSKNNKKYGRFYLEDKNGTYTWMLFGSDYANYSSFLTTGSQVLIRAVAKERYSNDPTREPEYDLKPSEIIFLSEVYDKLCKQIILEINIRDSNTKIASSIKEAVLKSKGKTPLQIRVYEDNSTFYSDFYNLSLKVDPESFIKNLSLPVPFNINLNNDKKI